MSSETSPPRDRDDRERSRLERIVPDLLKRVVEAGVERIADSPDSLRQLLADMRLPKEAIQLLVSQLDETKRELARVLARELREFLNRSSLADELTRLLSGLTLEVKTQVRFVPNPGALGRHKPEVKSSVGVHLDPNPSTDESPQSHHETMSDTEPPMPSAKISNRPPSAKEEEKAK